MIWPGDVRPLWQRALSRRKRIAALERGAARRRTLEAKAGYRGRCGKCRAPILLGRVVDGFCACPGARASRLA